MYQKMQDQLENPKSVQYILDDGLYGRVILEIQNRKSDRVEVHAQAFQIDADGVLMSAPNGAASRTPGTDHVIATSGVAGGTHVIRSGWVRVVGDYNNETVDESIPRVQAKPSAAGEIGDQAYDTETGTLYRFDMGELERIRQGKCEELLAIIRQSEAMIDLDF